MLIRRRRRRVSSEGSICSGRLFDREYSYFAYKQINWDSLRTVYRPQAEAAASQGQLVALLKEMVEPLRDVHVRFTTPSGTQQATYQPTAQLNWDRDLWRTAIGPCGFNQVTPAIGSCMMDGVAYIYVGSWGSSALTVTNIDALIDRLRDAPAMIVDVRSNAGGSNETFVSAMRELPNVVVLGDTTGGGSGNPAVFPLGDGWSFSVSRWIEWTADRRVIEWNGIPPDTFVPWDPGKVSQGRDPVLEAALALLASASRR